MARLNLVHPKYINHSSLYWLKLKYIELYNGKYMSLLRPLQKVIVPKNKDLRLDKGYKLFFGLILIVTIKNNK